MRPEVAETKNRRAATAKAPRLPLKANASGPVTPAAIEAVPRGISAHEVYRLRDAMKILGWKAHALRMAKRHGLEPVRFGREKYLTGEQIFNWFRKLAEEQAAGGDQR